MEGWVCDRGGFALKKKEERKKERRKKERKKKDCNA